MAVETTYMGYIVVQFRDETTRKYEVEMFETGLENMKTKIAAVNAAIEADPNTAFAMTFISDNDSITQFADRQVQKIIEGGVTITEREVVYTSNNV